MNVARVAALALLVTVATAGWAQEDERTLRKPPEVGQIRGAWSVLQIPGEGGPPPFAMLMLFTRDGGVVQSDAGPPDPLNFSPGFGEWERQENGHYLASYTQLQFDSGQNHIGYFSARMDVTIDDTNTLRGTIHVRFSDAHGVLLFEADGTVEGTRLPNE